MLKYYIFILGRIDEALITLTYLRGSELLGQEEIKEMSIVYGTKITSNTLKDIAFLKSMGIAIFLSVGIQIIGYSSITLYLQTILEGTNTSVSSELVSVIFGVMQVTACFVTAILSDRAGRKPILAITLGGLAIGMVRNLKNDKLISIVIGLTQSQSRDVILCLVFLLFRVGSWWIKRFYMNLQYYIYINDNNNV